MDNAYLIYTIVAVGMLIAATLDGEPRYRYNGADQVANTAIELSAH